LIFGIAGYYTLTAGKTNNNNMEGTRPTIMEGTKPVNNNNNMEGTPPLRGVPYPTF
jgi:hypothetical protein